MNSRIIAKNAIALATSILAAATLAAPKAEAGMRIHFGFPIGSFIASGGHHDDHYEAHHYNRIERFRALQREEAAEAARLRRERAAALAAAARAKRAAAAAAAKLAAEKRKAEAAAAVEKKKQEAIALASAEKPEKQEAVAVASTSSLKENGSTSSAPGACHDGCRYEFN